MKRIIQILTINLLVFSFVAIPALARAGGGESFSGGSFGGGSFGGGGYGPSSGGFFFLPFFFGGNTGGGWIFPAIIILFFFIIPAAVRAFGPNRGTRSSFYQRSPIYNSPINIYSEADISPIQEADPAFNKDRFIDMAQTVFFDIQNAWSRNDIASVRGLMSDSIFQRFSLQLSDFTRRHITNKLEQIAVSDVKIVKVTKDTYETITCAIHASMIDIKVDDSSGKVVDGNPNSPTEFVEYWTFMRSTSVKTKAQSSLVTKTCPNCGAPLTINESGVCKYCGANILSGDFDWVLSDISQQLA